MFLNSKGLTFENGIILTGIFSASILSISVLLINENLLEITSFIEIIVVIVITHRFLKIYYILKKRNTRAYK